jgi:pimeloyl-ACP methyl ester carboxylesterase
MKKQIFKNEGAKARMEDWYERFLNRSVISAKSIEVPTSFGSSHLLITGNPDKPPLVCLHSMLKGLAEMALPMILYRIHPSEKNLSRLVHPLMTTWDDDWAHYLGDSFRDFVPNLKVPPLASDNELKKLTMPCLIMAAEYDISFPGRRLLERVINAIPGSETELLKDSRHCPPTTPEFRRWLAERMNSFLN